MQPLEKTLRNKLERTIKDAREVAETAARSSLEQLGVGDAIAATYLSEKDRNLRLRLRSHGRQLGDLRNQKSETQDIERLVEETAYEHWHRMLFARFLAENHLLMYPDVQNPVSVSLEECNELAIEEGAKNGWELASRFAARMLPQIFRPNSPVFDVHLSPEHQHKLECMLADLPVEVFTASDSLGWVYQYWQAKKKEDVNESEVKIGARELSAVTQLFTEPYMVSFMLDNSLGAWWASRQLSQNDFINIKSEKELREKAAITDLPLTFLRFVSNDNSLELAAGQFTTWPNNLNELKILDPCCGSGHFLVAALLMLVPMRMNKESLSARDAIDKILLENLHGLELDRRCVELAAFALALAAWRYPDSGGYRKLPPLNLACSGLSVSAAKDEWKQLSLGKNNLRLALDWMHDTFQNAPILGSLIDPAKTDAAKLITWDELSVSFEQALEKEQPTEQQEAAVVAQGLSRAAMLLSRKYNLVITNVPYLTRGKQADPLRDFCEANYPEAKNDLATVFLERCLEFCVTGGTANVVLPQNWLFLTSYRKFREKLLARHRWHLLARLGEGGFESPAAAGAFIALISLSRGLDNHSALSGTSLMSSISGTQISKLIMRGLDVSEPRTAPGKALGLLNNEIKSVEQFTQVLNPDARIMLDAQDKTELLSAYADSYLGLGTGGFEQFGRCFWEFPVKTERWSWLQSSAQIRRDFDGLTFVVAWDPETNRVRGMDKLYRDQIHNQDQSGQQAWSKSGVAVALMRGLRSSIYLGSRYDKSMAVIVPKNKRHLNAIYAYCSSPEFVLRVREIDQNVIVANGTLVKIPFDLAHWTKAAYEQFGEELPHPYSNDPTQWIFHGHPAPSEKPLQVAVARLLGYRWPAELDQEMDVSSEARTWIEKSRKLDIYTDEDGIVCIPAVRGEASASDRLLDLLSAAYGDEWNSERLPALLSEVEHAGKSLETWLRDKFFAQHCELFHERPFVLHIWDGLRDGFSALVNYHKLDEKLMETLIYTYLGDWIQKQKIELETGISGAGEKLAAAETLKKRLELIREGEQPYDIFVRWKSLEKQAIGWEPDIDDGVRLNIRPFMSVPDIDKKGAGILRAKPAISWTKDRGKDVSSAPWFGQFKGDRINDHHLSLADKKQARTSVKMMVKP